MFNALVSLGVLDGAMVADLFAGSGALGIEALSRGAAHCTFVESNSAALAAIRHNLRTLGLEDRADVRVGRVETAIQALRGIDVVLADPPYGYGAWPELLTGLESAVGAESIVVIESGSDLEPVVAASGSWSVLRARKYGRTWVSFLQRT